MAQKDSLKSFPPHPLKVLSISSEQRAEELDVAFLRDVINNENYPEYNGYNTNVTREQGVSMQPKTKAAYLPVIDMTPPIQIP